MPTLEEFMQSMSNRPTPASRSREFDHKAAPQSNAVNEADILGNIDPQLLKIIAGGSDAGLLGAGGYSALQDR